MKTAEEQKAEVLKCLPEECLGMDAQEMVDARTPILQKNAWMKILSRRKKGWRCKG